jgi:hypothetical protein
MERVTSKCQPLAGLLQVSKEAVLPLVVGLVIGFSYGSGVIISASKEGNLSMKDRYAIAIFLSICHSIFEDTLLLVAIGASFPWMLGSRLLLAFLVTIFADKGVICPSKLDEGDELPGWVKLGAKAGSFRRRSKARFEVTQEGTTLPGRNL